MPVLPVGSNLWLPPQKLLTPGNRLTLNTNHWAYPSLISAIVPSDGNFQPVIYIGPQGIAQFPKVWASGGLNSNTMGPSGAALSFSGASNSQTIQSANQTVFGGLVNYSAVGSFQPLVAIADPCDVFRKNNEFIFVQYAGGNLRAISWNTGGVQVFYPGAALTVGDINLVACTVSAATALTLYRAVNNGAIGVNTGTMGGSAIPSSTSEPLAIGGAEAGGGELFQGNIFFGYFFASTLTYDQVASLFFDPGQIFLPAEPEMPSVFLTPIVGNPFLNPDLSGGKFIRARPIPAAEGQNLPLNAPAPLPLMGQIWLA
jgi:hypothetical protein